MRKFCKELYTDSPKGAERFVDLLVEVRMIQPPPEVVLIHFESQQQKRFDFPARMLGYHCLIYGREIEGERMDSFSLSEFEAWQDRKRLFSFVFCNYPLGEGITQTEYQISLLHTRLSCHYTIISFPMLSAREYLQKDNPVVCALAVFMNPAGFSPPELKAACYRKLVDYQPHLMPKQVDDIVYALETYISLSDAEKQIFQRLVEEVYPEVSHMITNPLRQQGAIVAKQETLINQMQLKFGTLPQPMIQSIQSIQEIDQLNTFLRRVITTSRLEEMGIKDGFFTKNE
ncbi:hypothetical protein HYR99_01415 [Candidatus Poribacteria bacterium]|nr:hypothetical protein [Candidatus Poribacteria bacterium]